MQNNTLCLSLGVLAGSLSAPLTVAQQHFPGLMLASNYQPGIEVADYWVCEKFDGVRAYWDGQQMWSRSGKAIPLPSHLAKQLPRMTLDGELWLGRGRFTELVSLLNQQFDKDDTTWLQLEYKVFDLPQHPGTYIERYQQLAILPLGTFAQAVEYWQENDHYQLMESLRNYQALGAEGLMLRQPDAGYLPTRSQALVKLKPYQDAEAKVVGYSPGKGKYQGLVGALIVEDEQGARFKLGSGLSDQQRQQPPQIGSLVNYRFNGYTDSGKPRFARFIRIETNW